MDKISDRLYLGDIQQAGRHQLYKQNDIDAVIQLTNQPPEQGYPPEVDSYQFAMRDGPENEITQVKEAVSKTVSLLENGDRIFVHCSVGMSRSVAVAAASVAVYCDVSFEQAIERIRRRRQVQVQPQVLQNARAVVKLLRQDD